MATVCRRRMLRLAQGDGDKETMDREGTKIRLKRVYDPADAGDGLRVLVDRLWPRGISKDKARIDLWLRDLAPSDALRKRIHADSGGWDDFIADYSQELESEPARTAVATLREHMAKGTVALLYAARNEDRNNATALRDWIERTTGKRDDTLLRPILG